MKTILSITLVLLSFQIWAQDTKLIITGKIIDANNKESVPFANIGIEGKAIGTVSNEQGTFELHLPFKYQQEQLSISCIGYETYSTAITDIPNRQAFNVFLRPKAYLLNEFTVRPEPLSPWDIFNKAIKKIPDNYIVQPYLMDGFYREYFKENDQYVAFAESAVHIYDSEGYIKQRNKPKEIISIDEIRVSDICNEGDYVLYIDLNYALRGNPLRNFELWRKYLKRSKYELMQLTIDSLAYMGNDLVYCMTYELDSERKGNYKGRVYIDTKTFAVVRLEVTARNTLLGRSLNGAPKRSRAVLSYKKHNGRMYLNYINANHDAVYQVRDKTYKLNFYSELLIHDIQTEQFTPLSPMDAIKEVSIFYQPRYRTFDPNFWENYQLFENSPANQQIITDLEQRRPLELQYEANGKLKAEKKRVQSANRKSYRPVSGKLFNSK